MFNLLYCGAFSGAPSPLHTSSVVLLTIVGVVGAAAACLTLNALVASPLRTFRRVVPFALALSFIPDAAIWLSHSYQHTTRACEPRTAQASMNTDSMSEPARITCTVRLIEAEAWATTARRLRVHGRFKPRRTPCSDKEGSTKGEARNVVVAPAHRRNRRRTRRL